MKTFDPKAVVFIFGGYPIRGFSDGTMITAERSEDMFIDKNGVTGEAARSKSNNRSGIVKATLMMTSSDNDYLSKIALMDERSNTGIRELSITDLLGTSKVFSATAYIKKLPTIDYGKEIKDREWTFVCPNMMMTVGGNF